jgi:hypothetical protein
MNRLNWPIWWTWDHSTNWIVNQPGKQTFGSTQNYSKEGKSFVEDYARAIHWAAANGIGAIGIAGLLRDCHGGVEAARRVVRHGLEHGVGIYGIAGILSYGGIYYEGDSPWSLENFLAGNPDCMAVDRQGRPLRINFGIYGWRITRHACPSNPKVMDYVLRSVEWLFRAMPELAGLAFETGDTGVCQCDNCLRRRHMPSETISLEDMALFYPKVAEAILSLKPGALVICETYHHFLPRRLMAPTGFGAGLPQEAVQMLSTVPKEACFQWVCDEWMEGDWPEEAVCPLEAHRHIMRAHFGTYWWGSSRHRLEVERIRWMCRFSAASGLYCVSLFGESPVFHANAEFNYLAQAYFSRKPQADLKDFAAEVMAPLLGGEDRALEYLIWNSELLAGKVTSETLAAIAAYSGQADVETSRRWLWLGSYLGSIKWDSEHQAEAR